MRVRKCSQNVTAYHLEWWNRHPYHFVGSWDVKGDIRIQCLVPIDFIAGSYLVWKIFNSLVVLPLCMTYRLGFIRYEIVSVALHSRRFWVINVQHFPKNNGAFPPHAWCSQNRHRIPEWFQEWIRKHFANYSAVSRLEELRLGYTHPSCCGIMWLFHPFLSIVKLDTGSNMASWTSQGSG